MKNSLASWSGFWHDAVKPVLLWRVGLGVVAMAAVLFLPLRPSFPNWEWLVTSGLPSHIYSFANFDGQHYLRLGLYGYRSSQTGYLQAFFPVYPGILSGLWHVTNSLRLVITSALLVSLVLCMLAIGLWSRFANHSLGLSANTYSIATSKWLLLLFPTSLFFAGVYTESLFLLLVIMVFLLAYRKLWLWAGVVVAIASATRVVGILLAPALLIELYLCSCSITPRTDFRANLTQLIFTQKRAALSILLGSLGLLVFCSYLWYAVGDPLYFFHVQSEFGGGRQESLVLLPQVIWRYLRMLTTSPVDWKYYAIVQELLLTLGAFGLLIVGWRRVRFSVWFFSIASLIVPTLTGTFSSIPRYILCAPAVFLIAGSYLSTHSRWRWWWYGISTMLLCINTMLFIQGWWVA